MTIVGLRLYELRFKETPLKGQKFVLFACTLRDILEGRQRSCRLATVLIRPMDKAERTREKRDHRSEKEKMKRERRVDLSSCTFSLLHFLLFFFVAAFISTHYSTHRQALGATLIGPSNRQVSLLPLKGASLVSPKTFPSSLKPSCFLRAMLPSFLLWICCIF